MPQSTLPTKKQKWRSCPVLCPQGRTTEEFILYYRNFQKEPSEKFKEELSTYRDVPSSCLEGLILMWHLYKFNPN